MPAKRSLTLALALLLVAAIPARAAAFPAITVLDTNSGTAGSVPYTFTAFSGYLYYAASNSAVGYELWRTDGTTLGTTLVKDINANGTDGSNPWSFTALGDYLYFQANDGTNGVELWRTDGTTLGTTLVKDINANGTNSSNPYDFTALGDYLYFGADDGTNGFELWRTDGTELGTTRVSNINTSAGGSSYPWNFTALGDYLYFTATDDATDLNLWRVDSSGLTESSSILGTNAGIGCECSPVLAAVNGRLFMAAYSDETGSELAYLDEPTFVLPETNRDGSVWSTALVVLAAVTAVAGVGLRMRGAPRS